MRATMRGAVAVLTADVIQSRKIASFTAMRDRILGRLSREHLKAGVVLERYTVTTWDEFQNVAAALTDVPSLIFDLRRLSRPLDLRIAVGMGRILQPLKQPINVFSGGPAFERARAGMEELQGRKPGRFRGLTCFRSGNPDFDAVLNLIYGLHDSLVARTSEKQWETINAQWKGRNQDSAARRIGVEKSTVSRNLQRGFYRQMEATVSEVTALMKIGPDRWPAQDGA
jgi:SatD family (SatD)